jgi:protein unc-79
MVGALPSEVDTAKSAQAAMSIAEQSPLGLACVSSTVVGVVHPDGVTASVENSEERADGKGQQQQPETAEGPRLFWETSVGRFRFALDQLPAQLRLSHVLLSVGGWKNKWHAFIFCKFLFPNVDREPDPDVQFFLLSLLKYLFLHKECLSNARREQGSLLALADCHS